MLVTQDMVGHKLGEFSHTKKRFTYRCVCYIYSNLRPVLTYRLSQTKRS